MLLKMYFEETVNGNLILNNVFLMQPYIFPMFSLVPSPNTQVGNIADFGSVMGRYVCSNPTADHSHSEFPGSLLSVEYRDEAFAFKTWPLRSTSSLLLYPA